VVVGLLFDDTGRILIARRTTDKRYGGLWEFPGGKVEPGESDPAALRREMR
jgi:8-oxo-dGTP diphosphatase